MSSRRPDQAVWLFAGPMVALDVVYLFVPSTHDPILIVLPALAAVAALIGVLRQRPRPGWPWWLVVGALGTAALSGLLHIVGDGWFLRGRASPDPYGVTVLATLLLAVAALAAFAYLRQPGARTWIIDTVLIGGIALLLGWLIVVVPTFGAGFTAWQKTMQVVLPFCGAVLIALAAPLVRRRGTVSASAVLLAAGAVAALVTIALFVVGQVRDISAVSRPYFWWHLFCIAWAAAALDGSMKAVAVPLPAPSRQRHPMLWALAVVVLGFAGPIIAIAQYLQEEPEDYNNWLLLITVVLFVLVLGRFGATVASTARERHSRVERSWPATPGTRSWSPTPPGSSSAPAVRPRGCSASRTWSAMWSASSWSPGSPAGCWPPSGAPRPAPTWTTGRCGCGSPRPPPRTRIRTSTRCAGSCRTARRCPARSC
ncbi:hypothetical protein ACFQ9X_29845 [Catenulispora yoronensis]